MKSPSLDPKELAHKTTLVARKYSVLLFVLFLVSIYGFLGWRINYYSQIAPDQNDITAQLKTAGVPKVDPEVVKKIQQLQDNSVNAQTLFDQARDNPFQE